MVSFDEILSEKNIIKNANVLSPHYIPRELPFRESQMGFLMSQFAPALKGQKPRNVFVYGKTGTGKTCTIKKIMQEFNLYGKNSSMFYINCRIYNSRYRILQKIVKMFDPGLDKAGFGLTYFYEKLVSILSNGIQLIVALDEIDMIKDLDELVYTLTRINDEMDNGGMTITGISNRLSFKNELDPRSRSSLYETEIVFPPYTSLQLKKILEDRAKEGFEEEKVNESAINLTAAIAAQESGDARYALKLLLKAAEIAQISGENIVEDRHVEIARKKVENEVVKESIATLPEHHQIVLFALAKLSSTGGAYSRLSSEIEEGFFLCGEVYEEYARICRQRRKKERSFRWYKEYLKDLEMLGLIITRTPKNMRGQSTLIKLGYDKEVVLLVVEKLLR